MIELKVIENEITDLDVVMSTGVVIENQDKTVSPTEEVQTITADSGYTGLGTVTVEAIDGEYVGSDVTRRSAADLSASGPTVTAPAGYYENSASKTIASGAEGTPTATKGTVSDHAVAVTPRVTNTAGYISGGTKTGTPVSVAASELVSGTKEINANGSNIDVTNYETANVNVPNTYSAGDEGKVVSNGALVAQTADTVTTNDTYDTTLINSLTVNVSDGGDLDEVLSGTLSGRLETDAQSIKNYGLAYISGMTSLYASNATTIGEWGVSNNDNIETAVAPTVKTIYSSAFRQCAKLKALDIAGGNDWVPRGSINNQCFMNDTLFDTLVIRESSFYPILNNINVFQSTPFASGGTGGTLYVPNSLISEYQSANNWSTILGYANNSIKSIESTHTDPNAPIDLTLYYVDGTPIT